MPNSPCQLNYWRTLYIFCKYMGNYLQKTFPPRGEGLYPAPWKSKIKLWPHIFLARSKFIAIRLINYRRNCHGNAHRAIIESILIQIDIGIDLGQFLRHSVYSIQRYRAPAPCPLVSTCGISSRSSAIIFVTRCRVNRVTARKKMGGQVFILDRI